MLNSQHYLIGNVPKTVYSCSYYIRTCTVQSLLRISCSNICDIRILSPHFFFKLGFHAPTEEALASIGTTCFHVTMVLDLLVDCHSCGGYSEKSVMVASLTRPSVFPHTINYYLASLYNEILLSLHLS